MTKPITSRQHGMLDYPAGILLILAPWIFAFHDQSTAATVVPIVIGAAALLMSLMTDYELSVARLIPMSMHCTVDVVAGVVLAISPFVLGFSDEGLNCWLPHVIAGLGLVAAGALTQRLPADTRRTSATGRAQGAR